MKVIVPLQGCVMNVPLGQRHTAHRLMCLFVAPKSRTSADRAECGVFGAGDQAAAAAFPVVLLHVGASCQRRVRLRNRAVWHAILQQLRIVVDNILADAGSDVGVGGEASNHSALINEAACQYGLKKCLRAEQC